MLFYFLLFLIIFCYLYGSHIHAYEALDMYSFLFFFLVFFPIDFYIESQSDLTSDGGTHGRDGPEDLSCEAGFRIRALCCS